MEREHVAGRCSYQSQVRIPMLWRMAKIVTSQLPEVGACRHGSLRLLEFGSCRGGLNTQGTGWNNALLTDRRNAARSASPVSQCHGSLVIAKAGWWAACTLLTLQAKTLFPSHQVYWWADQLPKHARASVGPMMAACPTEREGKGGRPRMRERGRKRERGGELKVS